FDNSRLEGHQAIVLSTHWFAFRKDDKFSARSRKDFTSHTHRFAIRDTRKYRIRPGCLEPFTNNTKQEIESASRSHVVESRSHHIRNMIGEHRLCLAGMVRKKKQSVIPKRTEHLAIFRRDYHVFNILALFERPGEKSISSPGGS